MSAIVTTQAINPITTRPSNRGALPCSYQSTVRIDACQLHLDEEQLAGCLVQPIENLPLSTLAAVIKSAAPDALDQSLAYHSAIARVRELFPDELKPGRYHGHDTEGIQQLLALNLPHVISILSSVFGC